MENTVSLILACPPDFLASAAKTKLKTAVMAYRIGRGFHLYRSEPEPAAAALMVIDDVGLLETGDPFALAGEAVRECRARGYSGIVFNAVSSSSAGIRPAAAALTGLCAKNALALWLPPPLAQKGACRILADTAISAGVLQQRLETLTSRFGRDRISLDISVLRMEFRLPSPSGEARELGREEFLRIMSQSRPKIFFSNDLCANYFTYRQGGETRFVLFDDARSVRAKLKTAEKLGIKDAFLYYPHIRTFLPDITK